MGLKKAEMDKQIRNQLTVTGLFRVTDPCRNDRPVHTETLPQRQWYYEGLSSTYIGVTCKNSRVVYFECNQNGVKAPEGFECLCLIEFK